MLRLFPESLVAEMSALPGAAHSFLRQMCVPEAAPQREALERAVSLLPASLAEHVIDQLRSVDNRRFFQGFVEVACATILLQAGWEIDGVRQPGAMITALRPSGELINVLPLSFIRSGQPEIDAVGLERLRGALSRVSSRMRFAVYVRKWLPVAFNPEPVRQAVELWLREVEHGRWQGRFAAYEDDSVVLEFGLAGSRAKAGTSPVIMTMGPFLAGRTVAVLEHRVITELDRYRVGPNGLEPVLVMAMADQPWQITRGYSREFLYGKPRWIATTDEASETPWQACINADREPCLFKDPLYRPLVGLSLLERVPGSPLSLTGRCYANPFGTAPLEPGELPLRTLAEFKRDEEARPIMRWFGDRSGVLELGAVR